VQNQSSFLPWLAVLCVFAQSLLQWLSVMVLSLHEAVVLLFCWCGCALGSAPSRTCCSCCVLSQPPSCPPGSFASTPWHCTSTQHPAG